MRQLRKLRELKDYVLLARDGEIGRIERVYFDEQQWDVRYFVLHGGGWLHRRDVLIAARAVVGVNDENKYIAVSTQSRNVPFCPKLKSPLWHGAG
jgi:uncharacterized protein YrrD